VDAVNGWEKDLHIYRLDPAPPKYENYQMYFDLYFVEKDEKYLSWFLHYYENELNTKARGFVNEYAMYGHFLDLKQTFVLGLMEALQRYDISRGIPFLVFKELPAMNAVHTYIRTMRTGYSVPSSYADEQLRKVMWQYAEHGYRYDEETIAAISKETGISPKNVEEILQGGLLNMSITDFYRHYGDEDSEESLEEVAADGTSQTEELYFRIEKAEEVMAAFKGLNYRERAIVAEHLGFCRDCYATHYYDTDDLDGDGKPKRKPRRKVSFIELAVEHGLASPDTEDKTYRRALEKMRQKLYAP
jgi:DNA-directed RNA polymerase specialized sigma subunit